MLSTLVFTSSLIRNLIHFNRYFDCGTFCDLNMLIEIFVISINILSFSPNPGRYPFDSNYPIGLLTAFLLEYIIFGFQMLVVACSLALGIGGYWLAVSATKDIQRMLHLINDKTQPNENQTNDEMNTTFSEYINAHAIEKQLSISQFLKMIESRTFFHSNQIWCLKRS